MARVTDPDLLAQLNGTTGPTAGAQPTPAPQQARQPRGLRNNNPGNLNFVGQVGARKEDGPGGRFAVFDTPEAGLQALASQLHTYESRGTNSVRSILHKFAPPNENNTEAYVASVAKRMGVDADQPLTLRGNTQATSALMNAIIQYENGSNPFPAHAVDAASAGSGKGKKPARVTDPSLLERLNGSPSTSQATTQPNPTDGMSTADKFFAGAGKAVADTGRTLGKLGRNVVPTALADKLGLPTQADIDEAKRLDAPLMDTTAGSLGHVAGSVAVTAPVGGLAGSALTRGGALVAARAPTVGKVIQAVGDAAATGGASAGGMRGIGAYGVRSAGAGISGGLSAAVVNPDDATTGAAVGAAVPVVGKLVSGAARVVRPAGQRGELARKAIEKYDIPLGVADVSDNALVKATRSVLNDAPVIGRIGEAQREAVQESFNRAVGATFGTDDAAKISPEVVSHAKARLGKEFDRLWNGNTVHVDPTLVDNLAQLQEQAAKLPANEGGSLAREIDDLFSKMQADPEGVLSLPGDVANKFQSYLRRRAESSPGLRHELTDMRQMLLGAFNRGVSPEDAQALRQTQQQYKALKTVEPLLNSAEVGVAGRGAGDVPAALLPSAVLRGYGNGANTPLGELSQIGSHFITDRVPRTGGSTRAMVQNSAVGGALGYGALNNPGVAALAIPAAAGLNKALGSPTLARMAVAPASEAPGPVSQALRRAAPVAVASMNGASGAPALTSAAGSGEWSDLDQVAADHGVSPKAAAAIKDQAAQLPPEQRAEFIKRAFDALERRGQSKKPGAGAAFESQGAGAGSVAPPAQQEVIGNDQPASLYWGEHEAPPVRQPAQRPALESFMR